MYEAWVGALGRAVPADEYAGYAAAARRSYAESVECTGCARPAYFIRQARNGRAACFGARPHVDGCPMATTLPGDPDGTPPIPDDPPLTAGAELVLRPAEPAPDEAEAEPDPDAPARPGGRKHARAAAAGQAAASIGMGVLLRRLLHDPTLRESGATLVLPDGARGTVGRYCVEAVRADLRFRDERRLYWGTIRYPNEDGDGGAWLSLGRKGSAVIRLDPETAAALLARHDLDDMEELQGAGFLIYAPLRKARTSDRLILFVDDLDWFALRLPDDDPL
jgi:hypothetical protein